MDITSCRQEKKMKMEDSDEMMMSPWHELPLDIFNTICKKLNYADQTSMAGVCKKWRSLLATLLLNLPFLFTISLHSFNFIDHHNNSKTIHPTHPLLNFKKLELFASKNGWLLLYNRARRCFFFYNPFSSILMRLPRIPRHKVAPTTHRACFSASPRDRQCVVLIMQICDNKISINVCSQKQDFWYWTTYHHNLVGNCIDGNNDSDIDTDDGSVNDVVFSSDKNKFYCVLNYGVLGAFDAVSHDWEEVIRGVPVGTLRDDVEYEFHLVTRSNGDVLLVCHGAGFVVLKMSDATEPNWVEEKGLGGDVVYLGWGHYPSYCVSVMGEVGGLSNGIYYKGHMSCWYYSLAKRHNELLGFPSFSAKSAWIEPSTFYRIPS